MRYFYITVLITALPVLLAPMGLKAQGQQGSGSPYSAYGLGDLMGSTQVSQALMGGTSVGLVDPFSLIHANPASYVSLRSTVFETGLSVKALRYELGDVTAAGSRADLLGLTIGVPIGRGSVLEGASQRANRWGFGLGVQPVSEVGYEIEQEVFHPEVNDVVRFRYNGDGGLNRAFIGAGLTLWQNNDTIDRGQRLAIGANLNYLFGSIEERRRAYYPRSSNYYNTNVDTRLVVRSPTVNGGIQYSADLVPRERLVESRRRKLEQARAAGDTTAMGARSLVEPLRFTIGLSAEMPASLAADREHLVNNFLIGSTGIEFPVDTIVYDEAARGSVDLPMMLGAGISIHNSRWTIALDHRRRDWSGFTVRVQDHEFRSELNTHEVYSLGIGHKPAGDRWGTLLQRSTYRAGVRFSQDYRVIAGTRLQEIGMGFGMSLPVMNSNTRSRINFGAEFGQRGTTEQGLLRERFVNVLVGITITPDVREQWFRKRRLE